MKTTSRPTTASKEHGSSSKSSSNTSSSLSKKPLSRQSTSSSSNPLRKSTTTTTIRIVSNTNTPKLEKSNTNNEISPFQLQRKKQVNFTDLDSDSVLNILDYYGGNMTISCSKYSISLCKNIIIVKKFMTTYYGRFKDNSIRFLFKYLNIDENTYKLLSRQLSGNEIAVLVTLPIILTNDKYRFKKTLASTTLLSKLTKMEFNELIKDKLMNHFYKIIEINFLQVTINNDQSESIALSEMISEISPLLPNLENVLYSKY